jgi:non-heme chloroperoxidase
VLASTDLWRTATEVFRASLACVPTWHEDFREDVAKIDVPTLVVHGDSDRIVPFSAAGSRTAKLINGAELVVIKDGPHNVAWTHAEEVNEALLKFLAKPSAKRQTTATKRKAVA